MTEDEFVSFIKENQRQFYIMAYHYVQNEQMALDIVQESIYRGFKNYRNVRQPEYMKTWFCRIVINLSLDTCKKEKLLVHNEEAVEQLSTLQKKESFEHLDLYDAVNQLDFEHRTIITLRFFEDMKIDDIAKILDMNKSTVKSKLYRTLRMLKKELIGGENNGI